MRVGVVRQGQAHPIQALRIGNDSDSSLPAGILTLYDPRDSATFAGDARLAGLPIGENRLLEFAQDLRTNVDWRSDNSVTLVRVTAAQGVIRIQRRDRVTYRVALAAPAGEARHLLLEIPRAPDATLVAEGDQTPSDETATVWRVPVALAPGEKREMVVRVDRPLQETVELTQDNDVLATILNEQALAPAARAALGHVEDARAAVAAREAERDRIKSDAEAVAQDEERLRKNIATVPANDSLHGKLVRALEADEEKLSSFATEAAQAETAAAKARTALEQAIGSLRLD
jgi:hypothetical protein